jgi:hypothetical protein
MVKEYKILSVSGDLSDSRRKLEAMVNENIANGWRPQGGLSFFVDVGYRYTFSQAMVRE